MSREVTRRSVLRLVGFAVVCAAVALLISSVVEHASAITEQLAQLGPALLISAVLLYVFGALLLSLTWPLLVAAVAGRQPAVLPMAASHLRAQLGKYLPGNVAHFAWRHLAARSAGLAHRQLAGALLLESVLLVGSAAVLSLLLIKDPRALRLLADMSVYALPVALVVLVLLAVVAVVAWCFFKDKVQTLFAAVARRERRGPTATRLVVTFGLNLCFFLLAGISLQLLITPEASSSLMAAVIGWYAVAWILGYVVPGAPGGIGVREGILLVGLAPLAGEPEVLVAVLAHRVATVVADALAASVGFAVWKSAPPILAAPPSD